MPVYGREIVKLCRVTCDILPAYREPEVFVKNSMIMDDQCPPAAVTATMSVDIGGSVYSLSDRLTSAPYAIGQILLRFTSGPITFVRPYRS